MNRLLADVLPLLGITPEVAVEHLDLRPGNALPSNLAVGELAIGAVGAAALGAIVARGGRGARVDPMQVAASFRSDQLLTVNGVHPPGFAPFSGFFEAADGWVRTHGNYPHHRDRLAKALGMAALADRDSLAEALRSLPAQEIEDRVTVEGGLAVRVRRQDEWRRTDQAVVVDQHPLLECRKETGNDLRRAMPERPRVLDLTRVIAGPVATRTLAFVGCDVLRVDSPQLLEIESQHIDVDAGKRSTLLNLNDSHDRARLVELLDAADVLVTGYRPGALTAYGFDRESVLVDHPHVVHASLSAWTPTGPWGGRRGFDSIVQAATGISLIESTDGHHPGALPAQALDHATGYLVAAGVLTALKGRADEGGSWTVAAHLARTAHWLLRAGTDSQPAEALDDSGPYVVESDTPVGRVVQPRPAFQVDDRPREFAHTGHPWGADLPEWLTA